MPDKFPLDLDVLLGVLNHLNLGVYITDLDRRILLWNRRAEEITGHRASDVVGSTCRDNILMHVDKDGHQLCSTDLCPLHRAIVRDKESDEPLIIFAKKADGSRIAVSVSVGPLRDDAGKVIGGIETFRDETTRILDLEFARKIQRSLLPESLPQHPNVSLDACYYPCDLVGGDFYDVRTLAPGRYGVLVVDVSGHGVSAALYTTWLHSLFDCVGSSVEDPGEVMAALNRDLARVTLDESFVTGFYALVDADRCEITYCNAGHPPPFHHHAATGEITELGAGGLPMGIPYDEPYDVATVRLEPGDLILCYTDGVIEVTDRDGEMIGRAGLAELLRDRLSRTGANLLQSLYRGVLDISGDVSLSDDIILLSIRATAPRAE